MQASGINFDHATLKHEQSIGMDERTHGKLKQILKINVTADTSQWDRYDNIKVMANNTTYHQSTKFTPTKIFQRRVPDNAPDLKISNPLQIRCTKTDLNTLVDEVNQKHKKMFLTFSKPSTSKRTTTTKKPKLSLWK